MHCIGACLVAPTSRHLYPDHNHQWQLFNHYAKPNSLPFALQAVYYQLTSLKTISLKSLGGSRKGLKRPFKFWSHTLQVKKQRPICQRSYNRLVSKLRLEDESFVSLQSSFAHVWEVAFMILFTIAILSTSSVFIQEDDRVYGIYSPYIWLCLYKLYTYNGI